MVDRTVSRVPAPPAKTSRRFFAGRDVVPGRGFLAGLAIAGLAGAFAWRAPDANGWAAAALIAALLLDGLARVAGARVARRAGAPAHPAGMPPMAGMAGMPSVVLAMGPGAGLGAVLFGAGLGLWPAGFPVLASALAGLVAMGALARLALARIVRAVAADPEA